MIDELLYKYYSVNAITDKGKVIDDWIDKANDYLYLLQILKINLFN